MKISTWGNTSFKKISVINKPLKNSLTIGNQNSYGDACIPAGNQILKTEKNLKDNFLDPCSTLFTIMTDSNILLNNVPGKANVTLGGAAASDVHGKDSKKNGSFIKNIDSLLLLTSDEEIIETSREKNPELFYTTIGGYGLTGSILGLKLKNFKRKNGNLFESKIIKGNNIDDLIYSFNNSNDEFKVAWVDLISKNKNWVMETSKYLDKKDKLNILYDQNKPEFNITLPFVGKNMLNTMYLINKMYFSLNKTVESKLKNQNMIFYPINNFSNTKNISKKRKIIQVQFSLPYKNIDNLADLIDLLIYNQVPLLCSIKETGENESNLNLSFMQKGFTVAVDFAKSNFNENSIRKFYKKLIESEGLVYLAKDSTLNRNEFMEMYSNFEIWRKIVKSIDPKNYFQSELSNRLGLKDW